MAFFETAMRLEAEEIKKLQQEYQKLAVQKSTSESQLMENNIVKEELDMVEEDANVYKLVGPVLVKQELADSKQNVDKRIDFITKEINRVNTAMQGIESQLQERREKMFALQQQFAQASAQQKASA